MKHIHLTRFPTVTKYIHKFIHISVASIKNLHTTSVRNFLTHKQPQPDKHLDKHSPVFSNNNFRRIYD